jgi:hypothetical protein
MSQPASGLESGSGRQTGAAGKVLILPRDALKLQRRCGGCANQVSYAGTRSGRLCTCRRSAHVGRRTCGYTPGWANSRWIPRNTSFAASRPIWDLARRQAPMSRAHRTVFAELLSALGADFSPRLLLIVSGTTVDSESHIIYVSR